MPSSPSSPPPSLPTPIANADSRPYWEGAREGRLMLQRCGGSGGSMGCGHVRFLPSHLCPQCWSGEVEWFAASGKGQVATFTIVHRAPTPEFAGRTPYVVALIDLEEGPRMMANILGDDALAAEIGDAVRVCFEERGDGAALPQFQRG